MKNIQINEFVCVSEHTFDLIYKMVDFILHDLDLPGIEININSEDEMMNSYGLCNGFDSIDICNILDDKLLFNVISHELRHAYQHYNKIYSNENFRDYDYYNSPWEKDAVNYEKKSYKKWIKYTK